MFQLTPYSVPFAVAVLLCLGLVAFTVRQGRARDFDAVIVSFLTLMIAVSVWSVARLVQLSVTDPTIKTVALVVLYFGYAMAPIALLSFTFSYTGRTDRLTLRTLGPIAVVPVLATVLAATNGLHGWLWTAETGVISGTVYLDREFTTLFGLVVLYITAVNLAAVFLLLRYAISSDDVYKRQAITFAIGATIPIAFAVLFALGGTPTLLGAIPGIDRFGTAAELDQNVDLTPIGFAMTGLCFGYAAFQFRFLDLVPVARDRVVEHMEEGYLVLDDDDRVVDLNPAARAIMPVDKDPIGEEITTVCPPLSEPITTHNPGTTTETEVTIGAGEEQRFLVATVSTLSEDDRRIGRLCVLRDVTERRAVQKRYQALIEQSTDLIYVLDEDVRVEYASPSVERQFGVPPETLNGQHALDFVHEEDRPEIEAVLDRLLAAPEHQPRFEYRVPTATGEWRVLEAVGRNLLDDPFVEGIVLNARDITDRKERERELERTNQRLEEFASVVSHDLRNPLNVAEGHLDLAIETGDEESLREVERSHDRMKTIIDEVLTMARDGQTIEDPEPISVGDVVRDAWSNVPASGAELVVENEGTVEGDDDRLLQLFENLFRNAIEHGSPNSRLSDDHDMGPDSPDHPPDNDSPDHPSDGDRPDHPSDGDSPDYPSDGDVLTIRVGIEDGTIYVADNGVGIPEAEREEVFDSGYTTAEDGTGFGLAIVQSVAEAHGWMPQVTGSEDGGARFEFAHAEAEARTVQ